MNKYLKPTSLTWWTGIIALAAGVLVAGADNFEVAARLAGFIDALTDDVAPSVLVMYGLTVIGLRGALTNA